MQASANRLTWPVYVFCAVVPAAFAWLLWSWYARVDAGSHLSGFFQADMPTYLCNARSAMRSPTLLSYASPWDLRAPPKPLLVQWHISLLGGLLALGLTPEHAELFLRLVVGFGMFVLLALIAKLLLPRRVFFYSALLTLSLGGGVAWAWALAHGANLATLRRAIMHVQSGYYWWCVELFRNLAYPLELVQHCIVFAYLLALMKGSLRVALVFLAAGVACSPFVALMLLGIHAVSCVFLYRAHVREHLVAALIAAWFVFHYKVLLAHDPVLGSVMAQHQLSPRYNEPLSFTDTLTGHGLTLLILPVLLFDWRFSARVFHSRVLLPMFALGVWSLLLIHHSRIPSITPMMPKHFTRGYPFLGLGLLWFAWLQSIATRWPRLTLPASIAAILCVPLSLPDNISYVLDQYYIPVPPLLLWSTDTEDMLAHLRSMPGHMRVLSDDSSVSRQVCAMTEHQTMISTSLMTPEFDERIKRIKRFLKNPSDVAALGTWHVDAVLLARSARSTGRKLLETGAWQVSYENANWTLYLRSVQ